MNKLLQRQIKKVLGENYALPEPHQQLFELINETYNNKDTEKNTLERMLELTSEEMTKLNSNLQKESREALDEAKIRIHRPSALFPAALDVGRGSFACGASGAQAGREIPGDHDRSPRPKARGPDACQSRQKRKNPVGEQPDRRAGGKSAERRKA